MKNRVALRVNGKEFSFWKSGRVTRSMESIAGSFELSVSDRWTTNDEPWDIQEEDVCQILLNGTTVITGYVEDIDPAFTADDHSLRVAGRDRAGQLVDCSVDLGKWEFKNISFKAFAEKVCAPHGITVTVQSGLTFPKAPSKFSIDPGDTGFNVLEQAFRRAGILLVSDGNGGIVLTRAGATRAVTALVEGKNMLAGSGSFKASGKFRTYKAIGQHRGSDEFNGLPAAGVKGTATDLTVTRESRTLIVRPEGIATTEFAKRRAEWEASVRAARAARVSATVQGWTQGDGSLWPINALVPVKSRRLRVDGEMLITQADHFVSDQGTFTELTLCRPTAFKPEPQITKASNEWRELRGGA